MKKLLCVLLTVVILAGVLAQIPLCAVRSEADAGNVGDANCDGKIDGKDALCIKGTIADSAATPADKIGGDINLDGKITARDSLLLKFYFAGLTDSLVDGEEGYPVSKILIAGTDISEFVISIPENAGPNVKYAAEELQKYIYKSCGVRPEILNGDTGAGQHTVYIANDPDDSLSLGTEGVDISVREGNLYITGGSMRGAMYGVYDFLERYIGWVFINDENEYLNGGNVISIADLSHYNHVPVIVDRDSQTWSYSSYKETGLVKSANLKLKISSWKNRGALERNASYGYSVGYVGTAHTIADFSSVVDLDPDTKDKKDYVCYSAASTYTEVSANVLAKIQKVLDKGDNCDRISVSPMDTSNHCTCRNCTWYYNQSDSLMGARLRFINRLSEEVSRIFPGTHILTTAYWNARKPCRDIVTAPNVDILFCYAGCNNHPIDGSECSLEGNIFWYNNITEMGYLKGWLEQCDTVYVWLYATSYTYCLGEPPIIDNIRGDIKYLADLGVFGIYCEGYSGTEDDFKDGNCLDLLTMYMYARCMWDPDMSDAEFEEYVDEYLMYYYGAGWESVREYMNLWYASTDAVGQCWCNNCDTVFDCMDFDYCNAHSEEMISLIDTAYSKAQTDAEKDHLGRLLANVYWVCLSATYDSNYTNGSAEQRSLYEQRYTRLYDMRMALNIVNDYSNTGYFDGTLDFGKNPFTWVGYSYYHFKKQPDPMKSGY